MSEEDKVRLLLLELGRKPEWPSPALLDQIVACGEAAVRPIDDLLTPDLFEAARLDEKAELLVYYALGALASLKTPAAIPTLIRAFPFVDEDTQEWMDSWLIPLGPDVIEPLLDVITNDAAGEYHRATASNIAVELAFDDPARRAQVADILRSVITDYLARFDELDPAQQQVVTFFSCDLVDMADAEARPMIEAGLESGQIDEDFFNQEWLEEIYAKGGDIRRITPVPWLERYRKDYEEHQSAHLLEMLEEGDVEEPVIVGKRLGRNEPCWCGSGKKYKKCHLAEDEKEGRL